MVTAIAVLVAVVVAAAITWPCAIGYRKKVVETKLGNAEDRAREIVDEALKTAETKKREAMLEATPAGYITAPVLSAASPAGRKFRSSRSPQRPAARRLHGCCKVCWQPLSAAALAAMPSPIPVPPPVKPAQLRPASLMQTAGSCCITGLPVFTRRMLRAIPSPFCRIPSKSPKPAAPPCLPR